MKRDLGVSDYSMAEFALGEDESILELAVVIGYNFAGFIKNHS